ncbi:MAG: cytochrome b/b6 domain-containing protein [Anaerolineales bacterium]|jgi:formate dehydrogenase subunit gamma
MTANESTLKTARDGHVHTERTFVRFSLAQRWEHALFLITFTVLLLTGLPQKYRAASWSQYILSTPERVEMIQTIHHIAAVLLIAEALYHVGRTTVRLFQRRLSGEMLPVVQDVRDGFKMLRWLLFIDRKKPSFGKFTFQQKFTYWFFIFGIAIMILSGLLIWFPVLFTRVLPGGIIPAAKLAHSAEAIAAAIFVVMWHSYHVHIERLNLSIFTGRLSEREMREFHEREFERLTGETSPPPDGEPE